MCGLEEGPGAVEKTQPGTTGKSEYDAEAEEARIAAEHHCPWRSLVYESVREK